MFFSYYNYKENSLSIWQNDSLQSFTKYSKQNKARDIRLAPRTCWDAE